MQLQNYFWVTIVITMVAPGHRVISSEQPKVLVELFKKGAENDLICQNNRTRGIYSLSHAGHLDLKYCCKGKLLVDPFWILRNEGDMIYLANWTFCDSNVIRDNDNDDLPTLMWKIYACRIISFLGKAESDINYSVYVNMQISNYTEEHNIRKLILEENKECPDAEKETVFHKRMALYFSCFHKNGKKVCQETTPESERNLQTHLKQLKKMTNSSCPGVVEGTNHLSHCCNSVSIPYGWKQWLRLSLPNTMDFQKLANGTVMFQKSYTDCMKTSYNARSNMTANTIQTHKTIHTASQKTLYALCKAACFLNPVKFLDDGSSEPELKLDFNKTMSKYFSRLNTAFRNTAYEPANKLANLVDIIVNRTQIIKLVDADEGLNKLTTVKQKAEVYCTYYRTVVAILQKSLTSLCS